MHHTTQQQNNDRTSARSMAVYGSIIDNDTTMEVKPGAGTDLLFLLSSRECWESKETDYLTMDANTTNVGTGRVVLPCRMPVVAFA
jgi:hypothetical protein